MPGGGGGLLMIVGNPRRRCAALQMCFQLVACIFNATRLLLINATAGGIYNELTMEIHKDFSQQKISHTEKLFENLRISTRHTGILFILNSSVNLPQAFSAADE